MFRKIIFQLIVLVSFVSTSICAQENALRHDTVYASEPVSAAMSTKVSMKVDRKLFPGLQDGIFISVNPRAIIMPMVMRADFDSLKRDELLAATARELDVTIVKKGTLNTKGKEAYFFSGTTNDNDRNVIVEVYFVKVDTYRTIMVTGFYDVSAQKKYKKSIKKAALSAIIDDN